ncbi:hypothetical protein FD723_33245 (plasmid) [Nostoc sp. C052]|uniref:hypothetical protein n=1 Tax=Nostoc sp. C052 TaxID=2576902 RepID=UPI0015C350DB|nr:hypothetical protein [Nostoc sp. C052]QLE45190.1 hypothetical protein FD723_33245 [Nostoc sp. C052]
MKLRQRRSHSGIAPISNRVQAYAIALALLRSVQECKLAVSEAIALTMVSNCVKKDDTGCCF